MVSPPRRNNKENQCLNVVVIYFWFSRPSVCSVWMMWQDLCLLTSSMFTNRSMFTNKIYVYKQIHVYNQDLFLQTRPMFTNRSMFTDKIYVHKQDPCLQTTHNPDWTNTRLEYIWKTTFYKSSEAKRPHICKLRYISTPCNTNLCHFIT